MFATFPPPTARKREKENGDDRDQSAGDGSREVPRQLAEESEEIAIWTIMYVDRTRRPGTEAWVFSTQELMNPGPDGLHERLKVEQQRRSEDLPNVANGKHPDTRIPILSTDQLLVRAQLLALLNAAASLRPDNTISRPRSSTASITDMAPEEQQGEYPPILVLGSIHDCLIHPLVGEDEMPEEKNVTGREKARAAKSNELEVPERGQEDNVDRIGSVLAELCLPITKYLIPPPYHHSPPVAQSISPISSINNVHGHEHYPINSKSSRPLPLGYSITPIHPSELPALISKSAIPRSLPALIAAPSVAIRDRYALIQSFGFLSTDGSLIHLYTEPEARGQGFASRVAGALVSKLVQGPPVDGGQSDKAQSEEEQGKGWFEGIHKEDAWVTSDIYVGNTASESVARRLGGRPGWTVRWIGVDLDQVRGVCRTLQKGPPG